MRISQVTPRVIATLQARTLCGTMCTVQSLLQHVWSFPHLSCPLLACTDSKYYLIKKPFFHHPLHDPRFATGECIPSLTGASLSPHLRHLCVMSADLNALELNRFTKSHKFLGHQTLLASACAMQAMSLTHKHPCNVCHHQASIWV
jgi:hypothetical protein